jgi:FKBP-type peptidyl-prolyl cis-trans isomerase
MDILCDAFGMNRGRVYLSEFGILKIDNAVVILIPSTSLRINSAKDLLTKKTNMKTIVIIGLILLSFSACKNRSFNERAFFRGYEQTPSGLYYKFYTQSDREKVQLGDLLFCVMKLYWCDERAEGRPDSIIFGPLQPPQFSGDLVEGLLMMRVGDSASFIIPADSVIKHWGIHKGFEQHLCDYLKIIVRIDRLLPFDSVAYREQIEADSIAKAEFENQISDEHLQLRNHVRRRHASAEPNSDGVYVVVLRKGSGTPIAKGKVAVFDYTARLLDGTIWDSSCENIAGDAGVAFPQRHYKPQEITIGEKQWMKGLDNALIGQTVGSQLRLFMPSEAVFGHVGNRFVGELQSIILDIDLLKTR